MNKELEEAIKILRHYADGIASYDRNNRTFGAIETVLQALENSISKQVVKEKVAEVIKLIETEQFKILMGDTNVCNRVKYILIKELLEGK